MEFFKLIDFGFFILLNYFIIIKIIITNFIIFNL
jgi:hypothetical protein